MAGLMQASQIFREALTFLRLVQTLFALAMASNRCQRYSDSKVA